MRIDLDAVPNDASIPWSDSAACLIQAIDLTYIRMWPREVLLAKKTITTPYASNLNLLNVPGVYVLYRGDESVYYIGTNTTKQKTLRSRLLTHARPNSRYANWKFFSAFRIQNDQIRNIIEKLLISAVPTARNGKVSLKPHKLPVELYRALSLLPN